MQAPICWEKKSLFKPVSTLTLLLVTLLALKMTQSYTIAYFTLNCKGSKIHSETNCQRIVAVPQIIQMFTQFTILLLIGALTSGYRVLTAELSRSVRKKKVLVFAFVAAFCKMAEIILCNTLTIESIILLSTVCSLITPVAVAFLINQLMKRLDLVEEYIILL